MLFTNVGINFFGEDPVSAGFGLFNAGGIIFMIVGITFSKTFADKYGKRNVFGVSYSFPPYSFSFLFLPGKICWADVCLANITWLLLWCYHSILWAMIADVADYSEWKNNRRATAIIFSAMMVGLKGGLSIGSALLTWILGLYQLYTE